MLLHQQKREIDNCLFFYKKFVSFFFSVGVIINSIQFHSNSLLISFFQIFINYTIYFINYYYFIFLNTICLQILLSPKCVLPHLQVKGKSSKSSSKYFKKFCVPPTLSIFI